MPFGLTIGTERAIALQQSIQDELTKRGYSPDADPVMAEYITIMVINNKTAAQITSELEDLIGSDFDHSFTDWLFTEAAKGATESDDTSPPAPSTSERPLEAAAPRDAPPHIPSDVSRRQFNAPRNGVYQHALSQALPSSTSPAQKRSASARSPSPSHPNKSRRTDVPTGPRAMFRDGNSSAGTVPHTNTRSLLDRVGGPAIATRSGGNGSNGFAHDDIQSRIDNIVNSSDQNMMMGGGFPVMGGAGGMDMNAMAAAGMTNPLVLQEMMMNQMALMAQMASSMGMMNTAPGQFVGQGFPMQGAMSGDIGMFPGSMNSGFQGSPPMGGNANGNNPSGRGRNNTRGGRGMSRGRGGSLGSAPQKPEVPISKETMTTPTTPHTTSIAAPTASAPNNIEPSLSPNMTTLTTSQRPGFVLPERPQSPTLCKFSLKCTNAHCRYAHPSPVATAESGVVLSNEACEKGKACQDKDCIKAHVSPAVLNPQVEQAAPTPPHPTTHPSVSPIPCRFGAACTRPGCSFTHPSRPSGNPSHNNHFSQQCRFGAGCTRATCSFQHPEGRVLPTTFHRGLSTNAPMVNIQTPETGSMGGPSPHRSVKFNNNPTGPGAGVKEKLEKQMKEIEEKKLEAEKAVKEAEAAASKKEESKPVAIVA